MPERDWKGLGPPMTGELEARLQALEEQLEAEPSSQAARQEILYAFGASGMLGDPRRLPHVIAYVRRFPGTEWITNEDDCWEVGAAIDDARHYPVITSAQARRLRPRNAFEVKIDGMVEYPPGTASHKEAA